MKLGPLVIGVAFLAANCALADSAELVIAGEGKARNIAPLIKDFELKNNVKVRLVTQGKEALLDFLPKAPADLVITSVSDELEIAKHAGLLQKMNADVDYSKIPERFRDKEGYWVGYSYRVRSIFYNSQKLKPEEVPTYEDLADPKWKGRLCTRNLDQKYNYAFVSWVLATKGEAYTKQWIEGLKRNAVEPYDGGDKDQAGKILLDKCDIAICNSYYMAELLIPLATRAGAAAKLGIMIPNQDKGGAFALVNGIAVLKQAQHPDLANKFIAYLESYMSQRWLADVVTVYPARNDIEPSGLLDTYGKAAMVETLPRIEPTPIAKTAPLHDKVKELIRAGGFVANEK